MKMEQWIEEQKKKYKVAIADYETKLDYAISHENPEGAERHAAALNKALWYVDEIIPLVERHFSKIKKSKK